MQIIMKKTIIIFFSLIISSHLVLAQINVSGTVLLENQTNHDSISIIFEMTAPNSSIDTTYTDINGNFNFSLPGSGLYNITYSKVGYFSEWLNNQTLVSNTNLAQDTLLKHTTIINIPSDFATVQSGIDHAYVNDTVLIKSGTYTENVVINNKSVVISSYYLTTNDTSYIGTTVIDGNNSGSPIWITGTSSVIKLIGLTIKGGAPNDQNTMGGGISISSADSVLIRQVNIYGSSAQYGGGISAGNTGYFYINSSKVHNNLASSGGGIMLWNGGDKAEIVNTIIANNTVQSDGGGVNTEIDTTIILNTIIVNNQQPPGRYGPGLSLNMAINDSVLVMNSIITGNTREGESLSHQIFVHTGQLKTYNSIIGANWVSQPHTDVNNLIYPNGIDPFINSSGGDYHLADYSSAIGSGISSVQFSGLTITAPSTDYNGVSRPTPAGSNPDIGAYESNLANPSYYYTNNDSICNGDSLLWHGNYYKYTGTYFDSLLTVFDCDSIYELSLSVMQNPSPFTISGKDTVILDQTEEYLVPDSSNLTYNWNVQNSTIIDSLSNYEYSIQWNNLGTGYIYVVATNQYGCTSDTAKLEVYVGSSDVRNIVNNENIKIYPNPANENLVVLCNEDFIMEIYDLSGRKLIVSERKETDISYLSKGIYFVKIVDKKGSLLLKTKLVIN